MALLGEFDVSLNPQGWFDTNAANPANGFFDDDLVGASHRNYPRNISESITAPTDIVTRVGVYHRVIGESISVSDSPARAFVGHRTVTEAIAAVSDAVARATVTAR